MTEKFSQRENNLYVPAEADSTHDVTREEMAGQNEVLGADGHGSIRADSGESDDFSVVDKRSSGSEVVSPFADNEAPADDDIAETPETPQETPESREIPDTDALVAEFQTKRADLQAVYDKLLSNYKTGAKVREHFEAREGKLTPATIELNEAKAALDEVNEAWMRNGGEAIDAAQKELDELDPEALSFAYFTEKEEKEAAVEAAKKEFRDKFAAETEDETEGAEPEETPEEPTVETEGSEEDDDPEGIGLAARALAGEFSEAPTTPEADSEDEELGPMARAEAGEWNGETTPEDSRDDEPTDSDEAEDSPEADDTAPEAGDGESGEAAPATPEVPHPVIPEQLRAQIEQARNKYAELTARDRKAYFGRFFKIRRPIKIGKREFSFGDKLKKLPGVNRLINSMNARGDRGMTEAKAQYEAALTAVQNETYNQLEAQEVAHANISARAIEQALLHDNAFEAEVVKQRQAQSKNTNFVVNWWVRQEGLKGKLKKGGAMLLGGVGIGTVGVIAGAGFFVTVPVAALAGGYAATHITRRRANGIVDKATGMTLAEQQSQQDRTAKTNNAVRTHQAYNGSSWGIKASEFTKFTESRTDQETAANRQRVRSSAGIAALGAKATMWSARLFNAFTESNSTAPVAPAAADVPKAPSAPEINSNVIVNPGDGYTDTLQHFASANGHNLTDSQSFELHKALVQKFGSDYININGGGNDIYTQAGDIRLTAPGSGTYANGVAQFSIDWMKSHRL